MASFLLCCTKLSLGNTKLPLQTRWESPLQHQASVTNSLGKSSANEQEKEANNHHLLDLNLAPGEQSPGTKSSAKEANNHPLLDLNLAPGEQSPGTKSLGKSSAKEANNHPLLDLNLAPGVQKSPVKNSFSGDCEMNNESSGSRKRLRLSKEQSFILEECFKQPRMPDSEQKISLASELNISRQQVESWFQNRRSRSKLKSIEAEREEYKKTCEELAAKTEWLEQELEMAKRANFAAPVNEHGDYRCPNCIHNLSKVKDFLSNMED